jgi:hypothetical protein
MAALFDIVILEKGNAGGGVLAGEPAMVRQATTDGMRFLELITDLQIEILGVSAPGKSKCASVPVT